jgi:GTP cyclohydrolase III
MRNSGQAHLIDALHRIAVGLGGLTHRWRFDRMATVCHPATGEITASFAAVAKHYGVAVAICPSRAGHRPATHHPAPPADHVAGPAAGFRWRSRLTTSRRAGTALHPAAGQAPAPGGRVDGCPTPVQGPARGPL